MNVDILLNTSLSNANVIPFPLVEPFSQRHSNPFFCFVSGLHKYSARVYEACIESFCALPITALVDGRFFCVHGGISPLLLQLSDLEKVRLLSLCLLLCQLD